MLGTPVRNPIILRLAHRSRLFGGQRVFQWPASNITGPKQPWVGGQDRPAVLPKQDRCVAESLERVRYDQQSEEAVTLSKINASFEPIATSDDPRWIRAMVRCGGFEPAVFWTLIVLLGATIAIWGPVLTSDGPAHVAMAHFMSVQGDPGWPLLNRLYEHNPAWTPNMLGDEILAVLMRAVPPPVAEQIVQLVCVLSLPLAGRLTLRRLSPDAGWLALFFFPVALQRMFFLGLYNYCLSLTGFLLCIWVFLPLRESSSPLRLTALTLMLVVTQACQAAGWIVAAATIGTIAAADIIGNGGRRRHMARTAATLIPGAILFAAFVLRGDPSAGTAYGASAADRLAAVVRSDPFAPIGRSTALTAFVLGLALAVVALQGGISSWRTRGRPQPGICLLPASFVALLLIIPDQAGGGWTHTWRMEPLPYIGLALACAVLPVRRVLAASAAGLGVAGSLTAIGMTAWVQARDVPSAIREFNEADALIGPHCSLAPVLAQFKLDPANSARLFYHPLFHLASRLENRADRAVLFSYVARLPIYPVRFRPDADPQRLLYGWTQGQSDTHVLTIDPVRYEAASGIPVDFILLWDMPDADGNTASGGIRHSVMADGYRLVHRSRGGRMELYRRPGPGGCEG